MKVLEQVSVSFGATATVFEVPSSMRTITIDGGSEQWPVFNRYHLSLPKMRFMSVTTKGFSIITGLFPKLTDLYGVFLGDDGEVCPMMLPNVSTAGEICLGNTDKDFYKQNRDVEALTYEIYSRFIQSHFAHGGSIMSNYFLYEGDFINYNKFEFFMNNFYTEWSSKGRNYDICSDIGVGFRSALQSINKQLYGAPHELYKYFVIGGI